MRTRRIRFVMPLIAVSSACHLTGDIRLLPARLLRTKTAVADHQENEVSAVGYLRLAFEAQLQDQWHEIMYSIDQPVPRMAIELKRIAPGERAAISWPAERRRSLSWGAGTYRLVVFASETETPALSPLAFRSGSFVVESERL